eukprot:Nk52_evm15s167 gene=Nk52_evmTU15s167
MSTILPEEDVNNINRKTKESFVSFPEELEKKPMSFHERYELSLKIANLPDDSRKEILEVINLERKKNNELAARKIATDSARDCYIQSSCMSINRPSATDHYESSSPYTSSGHSDNQMGGESEMGMEDVEELYINDQPVDEIDIDELDDETLRKIQCIVKACLIEFKGMKFLIADSPKDNDISSYAGVFKRYNVSNIVRACEAEYSSEKMKEASAKLGNPVSFYDLYFQDGSVPDKQLIEEWLDLIDSVFPPNKENGSGKAVCVHCTAGLGRAPLLVAIAFLERGMDVFDCLDYIRTHRNGSINNTQLQFLLNYKPRRKGKGGFFRAFSKIFFS